MEIVVFDTNAYRDFVRDKSTQQIVKSILGLNDKEQRRQIKSLMSSTVVKELLAHIADKDDPAFQICLNALKALYLHNGSSDSYGMIASPELLISKAFFGKEIPSKVETNKALGQMAYHFATNPSQHVFKKFQRSLNLNRQHVFETEQEFAAAMKQFVKANDPSATGWRIFEHNDKERTRVLKEIRSDKASQIIASGYLFIVYALLVTSGEIKEIPSEELWTRAIAFVDVFPEPIALYKSVMENLVNSEFNLMEENRSNFVWDIHLMFNVGKHSIEDSKLYFITSDKAIIRTAIEQDAKFSVLTYDEYMEYLN